MYGYNQTLPRGTRVGEQFKNLQLLKVHQQMCLHRLGLLFVATQI